MSQAELLSLIGALFALLCAVVAFIVRYILANHTAVLVSRLDANTAELGKLEARFEQRTKDKDAFDYAFRHTQYVNDISGINVLLWPLVQQVKNLDERLDSLHKWKHQVAEAYLPRAVDEHERRLNKLDAKVFNGKQA